MATINNLFDDSKATRGSYLSVEGNSVILSSWGISDYIKVVAGHTYVTDGYFNLGNAPATCFYNSEKEFIQGIANGHIQPTPPNYSMDKRREIIAPAGASYMRVSFELSNINSLQIYNHTNNQNKMAVISRGQITIVDLNDGKSINLYLGSSKPTTQIFNKENSSYVPSWTTSPYLVITPEVFVTGVDTNQISRLKGVPIWKINGSTNIATYGATAATTSPYALTIKNNLTTSSQLQVECEITYVDPETTAETKAKTSITYTKTENAGQLICAVAYAPNGTVFKNGDVTSLKAKCDMWRGSTIDNANVSYTWQKLGSGTWTTITAANAGGISGYTTNEITIPASAVLNFESFKCIIKDTDSKSGTYNTSVADVISFADMSDPYQVELSAPKGTTLTSGLTSTAVTVNCWQNGVQLPDSFFDGAVCNWKKYNKLGVLDTSWGTSGVKTGRTLTISKSDISVSATFVVEINK